MTTYVVERPLVVAERQTLTAVFGMTAVVADEEDEGAAAPGAGATVRRCRNARAAAARLVAMKSRRRSIPVSSKPDRFSGACLERGWRREDVGTSLFAPT
jgi:hypothetical protein